MAIEINATGVICSRCGRAYGRRKGYFPVNYGNLYKGVGYLTVCKECIDSMYSTYLSQSNDVRLAVRQVCRKLDLYWNDRVFDAVSKKNTNHTMMIGYIAKLSTITYSGKSYDDTLCEEGLMWTFSDNTDTTLDAEENRVTSQKEIEETNGLDIPDDVIAFWGPGYTSEMYTALEQRRMYWMSRFPDDTELDIGTEAIIRQICSLELDINRDRAAGRTVDKSINALNTLLGSASLKPTQKKQDDSDASGDDTPFGVWIRRWENNRPIPDPDPELKDVDGIVRYIEVWFKGHLSKMLGIKNSYSKMYEEEISKIRVEHPEYEDEDDEVVFNDIFGDTENG